MQYLINEANDVETQAKQKELFLEQTQEDLLEKMIKYCMKSNLTCSIEINDSGYNDVFGKIIENNDYSIALKEIIEENGKFDGKAIISKDNISSISIMTGDVRRVDKLNGKLL